MKVTRTDDSLERTASAISYLTSLLPKKHADVFKYYGNIDIGTLWECVFQHVNIKHGGKDRLEPAGTVGRDTKHFKQLKASIMTRKENSYDISFNGLKYCTGDLLLFIWFIDKPRFYYIPYEVWPKHVNVSNKDKSREQHFIKMNYRKFESTFKEYEMPDHISLCMKNLKRKRVIFKNPQIINGLDPYFE